MPAPAPPATIGAYSDVPDPNSPVRSDWAHSITPRVMHNFVDAADRTARWPLPPAGALSTLSTSGLIDVYRAGAWRRLAEVVTPPAVARGASVANQANIGPTVVNLAGLTLTIANADASHVYLIHAETAFASESSTDPSVAALIIADAANSQIQIARVFCAANLPRAMRVSAEVLVTGVSGARTFRARAARDHGLGTIVSAANLTAPSLIYAVDLGPA